MTSIITGDIINSRSLNDQEEWLTPLKKLFSSYGRSPKYWEIYRGDSFQLEIKNPAENLFTLIQIKACVKAIRELDVRMAIGVGEKTFDKGKITESNGEAFIHSGETFELLRKERKTVAIKTPWPDLDRDLNLFLTLAAVAMDKWTPSAAQIVFYTLLHPKLSQKDLGQILHVTQSSISEGQNRANLNAIMELEQYFRIKITQKLKA